MTSVTVTGYERNVFTTAKTYITEVIPQSHYLPQTHAHYTQTLYDQYYLWLLESECEAQLMGITNHIQNLNHTPDHFQHLTAASMMSSIIKYIYRSVADTQSTYSMNYHKPRPHNPENPKLHPYPIRNGSKSDVTKIIGHK